MSIKKHQLILYFFLSLISQFCFGTLPFPVTRTVYPKDVPQSNRDIHQKLKKAVQTLSEKNVKANYFACAFSFITENSEKKIICETIDVAKDSVSASGYTSGFLDSIGLEENDFFVFRSNRNASKNNKNAYANITMLQDAFYKYTKNGGLNARLIAASFSTINRRIENSPKNYVLVNTDSEAHAILTLQTKEFIKKIYAAVLKKLGENKRVLGIEFHGCTTRDMCPLCYVNMNILQYLALNSASATRKKSFLGRLENKLIKKEKANDDCTITTVISSLKEFPYGGNTLWGPIANSNEASELNCLYQFRFEDAN